MATGFFAAASHSSPGATTLRKVNVNSGFEGSAKAAANQSIRSSRFHRRSGGRWHT
jgi:hypothetical protein